MTARAKPDEPEDTDEPEVISLESILAEELKRREAGGQRVGGGVAPDDEFEWVGKKKAQAGNDPPDPRMSRDQLKASRELQSEGLEGLPGRAKELLTLGGFSFVPFLPFLVVGTLLFATTYVYFGDAFVHGGGDPIDYYIADAPQTAAPEAPKRKAGAPPPYVPPEVLLAEPSADGPQVRFDQ